jgi:hypothetical protein
LFIVFFLLGWFLQSAYISFNYFLNSYAQKPNPSRWFRIAAESWRHFLCFTPPARVLLPCV